jgi:hypothetical protein
MVKQCGKGTIMTSRQIAKQKEYSIYYLSDSGESTSNIAKTLGLKAKEIKDILLNRNKENKTIKTTSAPTNSKALMITETSVKGTKNVAIMTKAASEVNDAFRQKLDKNNVISRTSRNAIYRPNKK